MLINVLNFELPSDVFLFFSISAEKLLDLMDLATQFQ